MCGRKVNGGEAGGSGGGGGTSSVTRTTRTSKCLVAIGRRRRAVAARGALDQTELSVAGQS